MSIADLKNHEDGPTWGQRFRFARVWQQIVGEGDTDRALGEAVGRTSTQVKEWEGLVRVPNTNALPKIARRTGVDLSWLQGEIDEPGADFALHELFVRAWRVWLYRHPVVATGPVQRVAEPDPQELPPAAEEIHVPLSRDEREKFFAEQEAKQPAAPKKRRRAGGTR